MYDIPAPFGNATLAPPNPIPCPAFEGVSPREWFGRGCQDPAPLAPLASGAAHAPSREFCMMGGKGLMGNPLANIPFEVWRV